MFAGRETRSMVTGGIRHDAQRFRLSVLLAQPVFAGPVLERSDAGSQVDACECGAKDEERVEAAFAAALGFAMDAAKELDKATGRNAAVSALEAGLTAWEACRAEHCALAGATHGGGSGTGIAISSCWTMLGRARINELIRYSG